MPRGSPRQVRVDLAGGDRLGRGDVPVVSWWLPEGSSVQESYRIRTSDGLDTGTVSSESQSMVPLADLDRSQRRTTVQVQVATDLGPSAWSDPVVVPHLLDADAWTTPWVGPTESDCVAPDDRPAFWLRGTFEVSSPQGSRLHVTSLGIHEVWLNGARVGDVELAPGYTQYRRRVQHQSYDVADLLRAGPNVVAVLLADGWYRGRVGMPRATDQYGAELAVRLQVEDGAGSVLGGTDASWRSRPSHVLAADLIGGQREDRRLLDPALHETTYDATSWAPVVAREVDVALPAPVAPPVRRVQELAPVAVTAGRDGSVLVDLGQNINGWLRLGDLGPEGTRVTIRHGEHLDATGDLTTTHLDVDVPIFPEPLALGQVDEVTSAGVSGDVFEPRFTTHGFRYARIEGHPGLSPDAVTGVVVHSDLTRTGWFRCSDERVDRLHEAAVWSLRGNICAIPTDCPQRERAGWTGDWQIFAPTAAFLYDVLGFSRSWLRDVGLDQREDGCVPGISPSTPAEGFEGPVGMLNGSAGWGDVVVSTPWDLFWAYGDVSLLAECWGPAAAWVDYAAARAAGGRHPDRAARRPVAAPHETHLWDTGFHWGEWLEPGLDLSDFAAFADADKSEVATAYLCRSARTLARMAEVIGVEEEVVARYDALADGARRAWRAEFVGPDGALRTRTQAAHVRALAFDLVEAETRERVASELVALVAAADHHVGTGFLSTGLLLPVLADAGRADTAYALLLQDSEPSWLTMIDRGATTVWERWDGVDAEGVAHESLNHYSKGAVVSFLHRHVAGLVPTSPGYRTFRVRPTPGGGLTSADLRLDSPFGPIVVSWRCGGADFTLDLDVPPGTSADVVLPDATTSPAGPGRHRWAVPWTA